MINYIVHVYEDAIMYRCTKPSVVLDLKRFSNVLKTIYTSVNLPLSKQTQWILVEGTQRFFNYRA